MMFRRLFLNKKCAGIFIKPVLRLHSFSYKWAGLFSQVLNDGVHPKHYIIKYKEWFLEHIAPGWVVVDIGSNTGMLPFMLAEKAAFVYGIELSEQNVAVAKSQHAKPNIEYICADATAYNYDSCRPVNCVTLSNVLEHIEHRVDFLKRIVHRVKWVDADRKRLLFRVPMINREWIVLYKKELGLDYRLEPAHYIEYTLEQFEDELRHAGIVPKKIEIRFGEIYAACEVVS